MLLERNPTSRKATRDTVKKIQKDQELFGISDSLRRDLDYSLAAYKKNKKTVTLEEIFKKLGYKF